MTPSAVVEVLGRAVRGTGWFIGSVMGDRDYQRYLAHHARTRSCDPPMTEKQYWRARYDDQDRHPGSRCC